jgi:hypothetical protein
LAFSVSLDGEQRGQTMGMHIGLIAVETDELREAFSDVWPKFEVVAFEQGFTNFDAVQAWEKTQAKFVSAADSTPKNRGREVFTFWQDGPWAVLQDQSYVLCYDDEALKKLSERLGSVLSFVIETAGGVAEFWCFEDGTLRRSLSYSDGALSTQGDPLSEEDGLDSTSYYMKETEALWNAFGISPYNEGNLNDCQAICVVDQTDYGDVLANSPFAPKVKKPWWKFW